MIRLAPFSFAPAVAHRGNFRQVCLGVWHQQVFRLSTVDGVAELPTAEWSAALRPVSTQTEITLSAWRNCAHEDAVSNFVSGYAFSKLVDDAHGLMANDQAGFDGVFTSQNVQVRTTNCGERNANYCLTGSWPRDGHRFQTDLTRSVKNQRLHG